MKPIKRLWLVLVLLITILFATISAPIGTLNVKAADAPEVNARAAIAVDAQNGQILYQKNAQQQLPIASMSKLVTLAIIEQEVNQGKLKLGQKVKVTKAEAKMSENKDLSNIPLRDGQSYTVRQLMQMSVIKSADAATVVLARANGDSSQEFVQKMNKMAAQMGMKKYRFYNPVGLENGDMGQFKLKNASNDAENSMTATDVAKMGRYLQKNDPLVLQYAKQTSVSVDGKKYPTLNTMLLGQKDAPRQVKIAGLKTGTSDKAGQCFISLGYYEGRPIVTVVMHAADRFASTKQLYQYVANEWQLKEQRPQQVMVVNKGRQANVVVQAKQSTKYWLPAKRTVTPLLEDGQGKDITSLKAPVGTKKPVGYLTYPTVMTIDGHPMQIKAYAQSRVIRSGILGLWDRLTKF